MPVKRTRIGRSSSTFLESTDVINNRVPFTAQSQSSSRPPSYTPNKVPKTSPVVPENDVVVEQSRPTVLTVSSPVQDGVSVTEKEPSEGFLERCHFCKKKIRQNADLFMYGYLRAFCTAECRDAQINLEKEAEKQSPKSEDVVQRQGINK